MSEQENRTSSSNAKATTIGAIAWKILERSGSSVISLVVQFVMARLLAPEQFGMLSIMLVFVSLGNVVVQSGMNTALIQASEVHRVDCSTVFWMSFTISAALYIAVFLTAPAIASFYSMPDLVAPLRALTLLFFVNAYNAVQIALITRRLEMRKIFIGTVASSLTSAICGIGCAFAGFGVWALVVQQLSYQVSNCIAHAVQLDWRPHFEFSWDSAKRLFGFGSRLLGSGLLNQAYQSLSNLVIGRQFSATALGYVSQGMKYPQTIGNILDGAIQPVMLSAVSRVQSDVAQVRRLVRRALKTSTFLVVPAMTLLAVISPALVPLLLGPPWTGSIWFMQVYCIVYAMLPIHTTNLQALNGMGRSDLFLKLEIIKILIGVSTVIITAVVFQDIRLMTVSYIFTGVLSTIINAWPNRRVIGYSYVDQIRDILPAVLLTVAASFAGWAVSLLPVSGAAQIILQIIGFAVVYFGISALFRVEELGYLVRSVRDFISAR